MTRCAHVRAEKTDRDGNVHKLMECAKCGAQLRIVRRTPGVAKRRRMLRK